MRIICKLKITDTDLKVKKISYLQLKHKSFFVPMIILLGLSQKHIDIFRSSQTQGPT